jgi:hypothetical protein
MSDRDKPERSVQFHTTIHGGQQAIGSDSASFVQHNYANPAGSEFEELVRTLRDNLATFSDPTRAAEDVVVIEEAVAARAPDKSPVLAALERLAALATAGTTVGEAIAKAIGLVTRFWPF